MESSGDILDDWDRGHVCDEQRAKLLLEPQVGKIGVDPEIPCGFVIDLCICMPQVGRKQPELLCNSCGG